MPRHCVCSLPPSSVLTGRDRLHLQRNIRNFHLKISQGERQKHDMGIHLCLRKCPSEKTFINPPRKWPLRRRRTKQNLKKKPTSSSSNNKTHKGSHHPLVTYGISTWVEVFLFFFGFFEIGTHVAQPQSPYPKMTLKS